MLEDSDLAGIMHDWYLDEDFKDPGFMMDGSWMLAFGELWQDPIYGLHVMCTIVED